MLKHTINMFLEVFGYCEIVDKDENPIGQKIKIKEVSWRILPPGKYPWERAEKALDDYFEKAAFVSTDNQLYKQAGNGVTVNVVEATGQKIKEYENN